MQKLKRLFSTRTVQAAMCTAMFGALPLVVTPSVAQASVQECCYYSTCGQSDSGNPYQCYCCNGSVCGWSFYYPSSC